MSMPMPMRCSIPLCRYNGRASRNLAVTIQASKPGEALLLGMGCSGAAAVLMWALPIQNLDAGTLPVAEHEQGFGKGVLLQLALDQRCQRAHAFPKVHRRKTKIHRRLTTCYPPHCGNRLTVKSNCSRPAASRPVSSQARPLVNWIRQWMPVAATGASCTFCKTGAVNIQSLLLYYPLIPTFSRRAKEILRGPLNIYLAPQMTDRYRWRRSAAIFSSSNRAI